MIGWIYKDQLNPVVEVRFDANEAVSSVTHLFYAETPHSPSYLIRDGVEYKVISDHLGSVRLIVNAQTGQIVQQANYSSFGEVTFKSGDFISLGFAGGLTDEDSDLIRFGSRDFDPQTGRWTTKDPIRFGGDPRNLYRFNFNDTINRVDITGQRSWTERRIYGEIKNTVSEVEKLTKEISKENGILQQLLNYACDKLGIDRSNSKINQLKRQLADQNYVLSIQQSELNSVERAVGNACKGPGERNLSFNATTACEAIQ